MAMTVADIMSSRVVTVHMDDRLYVVKEIFEQAPFHHLVVLGEAGEVVGVLTERDLGYCISPYLDSQAELARDKETLMRRVHQVMTRRPITIGLSATLEEAAHKVLTRKIGCLPVMDAGQLQGIITWKDLLAAMLACLETKGDG